MFNPKPDNDPKPFALLLDRHDADDDGHDADAVRHGQMRVQDDRNWHDLRADADGPVDEDDVHGLLRSDDDDDDRRYAHDDELRRNAGPVLHDDVGQGRQGRLSRDRKA